jgi:hypothetical protein
VTFLREQFHAFTRRTTKRTCAQIYIRYVHTMSNAAAKSLRKQINLLAADLRKAEAQGETKTELKNRKLRIRDLERQLTEG